jgi:hypothetical protein
MAAIFQSIQSTPTKALPKNTDGSLLDYKVLNIQSAIKNISTQLAQIVQLSSGVKGVIETLIDTQAEIENSASSVQTNGEIFKDTLTATKKDILLSLNSFDGKIGEINNVIKNVTDTIADNQTELSDSIVESLDLISKQIVGVNSELTIACTSFEKASSNTVETLYPLLQNITKQIQSGISVLTTFDKNIKEFNSTTLNLTQRITNIENYIWHSGCWYGRDEDTGDFDNESTAGWLMTAAPNEFGEPVLISNGNDVPYAIRHIFIASANMANKLYKIRFYCSESDSFTDAVILSELLYIKVGNLLNSAPLVVSSPLISSNSSLWCAIKCEAPTATLSLLISI